jgi:hypothetical protein
MESVMKIRKATESECKDYAAQTPRPVYPLYGFVKFEGFTLPVEFPNEGPGEPKYEIIAPAGHHFVELAGRHLEDSVSCNQALHTLLGVSRADVLSRLSCQNIEACIGEK